MISQRISELLVKFGEESNLRGFYKLYLTRPEEEISIDLRALTNQFDLERTQWGYSSERMDEEIKLILVMDRKRNHPLYFRYILGSIMDVSTLSTTNSEMEKLEIKHSLSIMDAGFFSESNIRFMMQMKIDFLMSANANRTIYHDLVEFASDIENPEKVIKY